MKAIIYTSNTGSTASYAKMLGQKLNLPVYSGKDGEKQVPANSEIIYLGWIMAGKIKGYESMLKRYKVSMVCAVGMSKTGTQLKEIRSKNSIPENVPLFTLQGNFNIKKLKGIYKIMMTIMMKVSKKTLANKKDLTLEEADMLDMMINPSEHVKVENLKEIIDLYNKEK